MGECQLDLKDSDILMYNGAVESKVENCEGVSSRLQGHKFQKWRHCLVHVLGKNRTARRKGDCRGRPCLKPLERKVTSTASPGETWY